MRLAVSGQVGGGAVAFAALGALVAVARVVIATFGRRFGLRDAARVGGIVHLFVSGRVGRRHLLAGRTILTLSGGEILLQTQVLRHVRL